MASAAGYFEHWTNEIRQRLGPPEKQLLAQLTAIIQREVGGQVFRAGSQRKGTGIEGSDLDLCVTTPAPVTEARRRALAAAIREALKRDARVQWHVIRIVSGAGLPKVDVAFANAAFGSRRLPDDTDFKGRDHRKRAARALKHWARSHGFKWASGWALEQLVVHLASPGRQRALTLTHAVLTWLAERATPAAIEGVLRPHAEPEWNAAWSAKLPGRVEALANAARRTLSQYAPDAWTSAADAGAWMTR